MKSSEEGLTKTGLINCNITESLAKKMLVYKKLVESPAPSPSLFWTCVNWDTSTQQFIFHYHALLLKISWCKFCSNVNWKYWLNVYNFILHQIIKRNIIWGHWFPRRQPLIINVFQNIKFKKFVNDNSYYLCVFVFYVFWKCNIGSKSYVGIVITSKDIFKQRYMYIANFELLPLLNHSTDNEKHTTYQCTRLSNIYDSLCIFLKYV